MSIPEVLLRLGCVLVAWMVVYTQCIWLATLRTIGCGPDGDEMWRLLLGFSPFAIGFAVLLTAIHALPEIARILRWAALPLVVLVPLAALPVMSALNATTFGGDPICGDPAAWHRWWAPVQIVTLVSISFAAIRAWRIPDTTVNQ